MNHESFDLHSETSGHPDESEHAHAHAASEAGSLFAEYRRRQLDIFRERESALELDESAI